MKNVLSLLVLAAVAIVAIFQAEAAAVVPGDYAKSFTITFPGYSGSTTLTDFPVLVKISAARNGGNKSTLLAGWATLKLGGGAGQNSFPGSIDEVRISNVARSADWVKASHDTVTESSFAHYGAAKENGFKGMLIFVR